MQLDVFDAADAVAEAAAGIIAAQARSAVRERARFVFAVSGGRTPQQMLRLLSREDVPWHGVHLFQVDERIGPPGHPDRNLTGLRESLTANVPLAVDQIHGMPVEAVDLDAATESYERELSAFAGAPPVLDLVHLGLGPDGHTASLLPEDQALELTAADVALTGRYQGRRRMTMTYPILNRARHILWLVTGHEKAPMLARLLARDRSIPAGRVNQSHARVLADRAASGRDS